MQKAGWYDFRAEGLSLERLLNQCVENGVHLKRVKKTSARALEGCVAAADLQRLQALAEARGWRLTVLDMRGPVRLSQLVKRRALLIAGVLVFLALTYSAVQCVWFIDIRGAGPYTGEVQRILASHDVHAGRFLFRVDTDAIRQDMERELTGLAFVGVSTQGVTVTVNCVQARLAKTAAAVPGDLVAAGDGVIDTISVVKGTAQVKVGDVVRRGQVLVRGSERAWSGATQPIRAEATVSARIWYKGEAFVSGTLSEPVPTGDAQTVRSLCVPSFEYALEDAPEGGEYEIATRLLPIGGPMPVWLKLSEYQPVSYINVPRDMEQVKQEAATAAQRIAREKVAQEAIIVDKWVEYSMIKESGCTATAVIEAVVDIAEAAELPI